MTATPAPSASSASKSKHSGLTNYNTTTRQPSVSVKMSQVGKLSATGGAARMMSGVEKGVVVLGAMGVGAMIL